MISRPALLVAALAALGLPGPARPANAHKLKSGAEGPLCLGCHPKFVDQLKQASVHTPVRSRQCTGCHSPHASQHGKLLADTVGRTCAKCHQEVVPRAAKSVHPPAAANDCATCHAPHASANANLLTKPPGELCGTCHGELVKAASAAKVKHQPLERTGCTACHDAHGSAVAPALLTKALPDLCVGCHKTDKPIFAKWHMGYAVGATRCTACHDPHGSSQKGMLYDDVHPPVAKGMCTQCHEAPGSAAGFTPKEHGGALCNRCHSQAVGTMLAKASVHQPVLEGDACITCHDPHASKQKRLLAAKSAVLCGRCHADTVKRHELSPTKHQPVGDGDCSTCHDPHGSDNPLLFAMASVTETCGQCHEWRSHSTHPLGEKVKDPRNRNLTVECLSCHRAHGTEFKRLMPFAQASDLCTKCHEQYKR